jgi:hypothetical protein
LKKHHKSFEPGGGDSNPRIYNPYNLNSFGIHDERKTLPAIIARGS